jgi:hypothetical protein
MSEVARADQLATRRATWRVFRRSPSGRVILPVVVALVAVRLLIGRWGWSDLAVVAAVGALTGPVEWTIHLHLLHASPDAWTSRRLGLGSGHREHHVDPPEIRWLMLPGLDAGIFLVVLGVWTLMWAPLVVWAVTTAVGGAFVPPIVTALMVTAGGLGHYEWVHLLDHTRYRPRSRYYARLARNHRWHHYRNERYWLGITSHLGDRIMRTLPRTAGDVPLSGTARTLGIDPDA